MATTSIEAITSTAAAGLAIGRNGASNPVLQADCSVSSQATGVKVIGRAANAGADLVVISSGTNENLKIDAKGSGTVSINTTATGAVALGANTTVTGTLGVSGNVAVNTDKLVVTASSGAVVSASSIKSSNATAGIGYATGAGGTVTQATSKSTGVTLSKVAGEIVMHDAELADGAVATFTVTNTAVAATDVIIVNHASVGTAGTYHVWVSAVAAGSFKISVRNISGDALSEAIKLNVAVIKAVAA